VHEGQVKKRRVVCLRNPDVKQPHLRGRVKSAHEQREIQDKEEAALSVSIKSLQLDSAFPWPLHQNEEAPLQSMTPKSTVSK